MTGHKFGGEWTQDKLSRLQQYLEQYRLIFTQNERAHYFRTWYVDAFAGTGSRVAGAPAEPELSLFQDVYGDKETAEYQDGSARIALSLAEPFHNYLFIDKSKKHIAELQQTISAGYARLLPRCTFQQGDANTLIKNWCRERDWTKERAVVFLDPYGMQVEWSTVEALAATKGVDLWYLFPLGVGAARLLKHSGEIEEGWKKRLDLLFGTRDWESKFYNTGVTTDLWGEESETRERTADIAQIEAYIHERLGKTFVKVAKGLVLKNSRSSPMYLLCFAAANEVGAPTAIRIAQYILSK
jgi:three-Cys-motif partner protein